MIKAVLGFYFSHDRQRVLLIEKNRPAWQKGKLNGIGGKIKFTNEPPGIAMIREFREEAGIHECCWKDGFRLIDIKNGWDVKVFYTFGRMDKVYSPTDELVREIAMNNLPENTIYNLRWMLPLLLDDFISKDLVFILRENNEP